MEMAIHSNILAWKIPWTEDLAGYSPWGQQRVRHDLVTKQQQQQSQVQLFQFKLNKIEHSVPQLLQSDFKNLLTSWTSSQYVLDSLDVEPFPSSQSSVEQCCYTLLALQSQFQLFSLFIHQLASIRKCEGNGKTLSIF